MYKLNGNQVVRRFKPNEVKAPEPSKAKAFKAEEFLRRSFKPNEVKANKRVKLAGDMLSHKGPCMGYAMSNPLKCASPAVISRRHAV